MRIIVFLMAVIIGCSCVDVKATLSPGVLEVQSRTSQFVEIGYTQAADDLARQTTRQLLTPSPDKIATSAEADVMVDAHLKTELYYAFNTQYGTGRERDHRIVYDFICQLDKSAGWTPLQKVHFTILTVLSLAAQEYFWNEKSTILDLQNRVRRELRYGLFNKVGHKLNISNAVRLDEAYLDRIITGWVNEKLYGQLGVLLHGFKDKALGKTYEQIVVCLDAQFQARKESLPFGNLSGLFPLSSYGLVAQMDLNAISSLGDGMCGEHSLFIPTDGPLSQISEGNGRYKILRAILDNPTDGVAKRLYLLNSKYMDGVQFEGLMTGFITRLQSQGNTQQAGEMRAKLIVYQEQKAKNEKEKEEKSELKKQRLLREVLDLTGLRDVFDAFNKRLLEENSCDELSKDKAIRDVVDAIILLGLNRETGGYSAIKVRWETIKTRIEEFDQQIAFKRIEKDAVFKAAKDNALKDWSAACSEVKELAAFVKQGEEESEELKAKNLKAKEKWSVYQHTNVDYREIDELITQKYKLIIETLKELIIPEILLNDKEAFSIQSLSNYGYCNFINDICRAICELARENEKAASIQSLWDNFDIQKSAIEIQMDEQLLNKRLAMVESLPVLPDELSSTTLAAEMEAFAKRSGELSGWLPCDAVYTQLWAVLNNFNVFVFSRGEALGRTPLDVIIRTQGTYGQFLVPYIEGITGKHLATVILTSSTAKNVYLDKSPAHYDKFIEPGDYAAMARAKRHLAWMGLESKYAQYPGS